MKEKFKLGNVALYAKGWYNKTNDIWVDLKKMLEMDDYSPFTNEDVYMILLHNYSRSNLVYDPVVSVMTAIHPKETWRHGYYHLQGNLHFTPNECKENLEDYCMMKAFAYYLLSTLRFSERDKVTIGIPKYSKENRRPNDITISTIVKVFSQTNKSKF